MSCLAWKDEGRLYVMFTLVWEGKGRSAYVMFTLAWEDKGRSVYVMFILA